MKTVKTPKGTELPLVNLKGKSYLMVGHRIQWMNEEVSNFEIETEFLLITDEQTICKAKVKILDKDGKIIKKAEATKRETKKDFSDHTEKAETSSIGRALAILGFGTQFALSDLDEGSRLADSPLENVKTTVEVDSSESTKSEAPAVKKSTFRKPTVVASGSTDGWE